MPADVVQGRFADAETYRRKTELEKAVGGNDMGGDGGDTGDRITRLETHMAYVRKDLDEIKADLKVLPQLATKRDLETWRGQWLVIGVGIVALVVGGVVGGLAIINHAAGPTSPPTPIIIQVPTPLSTASGLSRPATLGAPAPPATNRR